MKKALPSTATVNVCGQIWATCAYHMETVDEWSPPALAKQVGAVLWGELLSERVQALCEVEAK